MNATAAHRVFHPAMMAIPPAHSITIAITASTCGSGKPLSAMEPTVSSKPVIF